MKTIPNCLVFLALTIVLALQTISAMAQGKGKGDPGKGRTENPYAFVDLLGIENTDPGGSFNQYSSASSQKLLLAEV